MTCEINDNPCDECTERYCPDQLEDVHNTFAELKSRVNYLADELRGAKIALAAHKSAHSDVLNNQWKEIK